MFIIDAAQIQHFTPTNLQKKFCEDDLSGYSTLSADKVTAVG